MIRRVSETTSKDVEPEPTNEPPETASEQMVEPGTPFSVPHILPSTSEQRLPRLGRGRRSHTIATDRGGHYLRAIPPQGSARDIALIATLRAAALRMANRDESGLIHLQDTGSPLITLDDLRVKVRHSRTGNLILFVVDASGSMGARKRMVAVKGAILSLLLDAYQKRDRVGLIAFRGSSAELLVPPTNSVELAERSLRRLPTGGRTPLAAGLQLAGQTLTQYLQRDTALTPLLVLVTDGRANDGHVTTLQQAAISLAQKRIAGLVLDSEQGFVRLGAAREIAAWLAADYWPLDQLQSEAIVGRVRQRINGTSA